ncbi:hypothetical protein V6N12_075340 [Hibiscus sabdariffa]|uniref:Vacuole membrane protein KMS1 n=1 Tax=Hibiscus sabdariffa TaxID=183260 RepID=A0ABR2C7B5_9ROSI
MATIQVQDLPISGLHEKHREELGNLTLTNQPLRTLKLFVFAVTYWIRQAIQNRAGWFMFSSILAGSIGILVVAVAGPHEMIQELFHYFQFGVWWLALGVASSIGLGKGSSTLSLSAHGSRVPLSSILPQVQLEAILWGIGTALGELPPYFISRAARISGSKLDIMNDLGSSPMEDGSNTANHLKQIKNWLLSHSQYLNFFTILILASVPNPLFDLAGIMCGQFGIPFWKFFLATLLGKAIIKTHIQTAFIISVCNYQLPDLIENEFVRVLSFIPGLATIMPNLTGKLHTIRDKYMSPSPPVSDNIKVNKWGLSVASIWNTVVWLMLLNMVVKIVTATAQNFLKEQQEKELITLSNNSSESNPSASKSI